MSLQDWQCGDTTWHPPHDNCVGRPSLAALQRTNEDHVAREAVAEHDCDPKDFDVAMCGVARCRVCRRWFKRVSNFTPITSDEALLIIWDVQ